MIGSLLESVDHERMRAAPWMRIATLRSFHLEGGTTIRSVQPRSGFGTGRGGPTDERVSTRTTRRSRSPSAPSKTAQLLAEKGT